MTRGLFVMPCFLLDGRDGHRLRVRLLRTDGDQFLPSVVPLRRQEHRRQGHRPQLQGLSHDGSTPLPPLLPPHPHSSR